MQQRTPTSSLNPLATMPPPVQLAGAVLDVTDPEPLPADHPLWRHPKVRIFPHRATAASEGVDDTIDVCLDNRCGGGGGGVWGGWSAGSRGRSGWVAGRLVERVPAVNAAGGGELHCCC